MSKGYYFFILGLLVIGGLAIALAAACIIGQFLGEMENKEMSKIYEKCLFDIYNEKGAKYILSSNEKELFLYCHKKNENATVATIPLIGYQEKLRDLDVLHCKKKFDEIYYKFLIKILDKQR